MPRTRPHTFLSDRRGGVAIYVALAMPVLVGGMGLGGEAGYRYHNQRLLQHAADFAAHAGAVHKAKGDTKDEIDAAALNVAISSDYDGAVGVIEVNIPPLSGSYTGDPTAVEVILTETRPRLFSAIFAGEDDQDVVIPARAVAAVTGLGQPACILALSKTENEAVTVGGNGIAELVGCSVASNSSSPTAFYQNGSGRLEADCVVAVGGADYNLSTNPDETKGTYVPKCGDVLMQEPPVADPYYWVKAPPEAVDSCPNLNGKGKGSGKGNKDYDFVATANWDHPSGETVKVMRFCSGLKAQGNITFAPGIYIFEGDFETNAGAVLTSIGPNEGVTFYITNGAEVKFNGNTTLNLSAPTSGPTSGILFFGDRSDSVSHEILGNSVSELTGAIYMPGSHVKFTGNSTIGGGGCTQVIANTIELTGNSGLASECEDDGVEEILIGQVVSVVE